MNEALNYYKEIQYCIADTSLRNFNPEIKFIGSFVQSGSGEIIPVAFPVASVDFISYTLFFFITVMAFIWSFLPERVLGIFSISTKKGFSRTGEVSNTAPGLVISLIFFLNFAFGFSFFIFFLVKNFMPGMINSSNNFLFIAFTLAGLLVYYLFRIIFIKILGFIFKTNDKATQQLNIYMNTDNAFGVLLIPVLLVSMYSQFQYILWVGVIIFFIFMIIRWFMTFSIGMSVGGFNVLHLILYLCTLEIIPVLIVIKLIENKGIY